MRAVGPHQSVGRVSVVGPADESDRSANVNGHCRPVTVASDLRHVRRRWKHCYNDNVYNAFFLIYLSEYLAEEIQIGAPFQNKYVVEEY